jgi:hypothetical protein
MHRVLVVLPLPFQVLGVMVAQLVGLFLGEVLLLGGMEMLLHLADDMLGLVMVLDIEIGRRLFYLIGVPALRTELPLLEVIGIGERPAPGAPDNEVHSHEVISRDQIKNISAHPFRQKPDIPSDVKPGGNAPVNPAIHSETLISAVCLIEM